MDSKALKAILEKKLAKSDRQFIFDNEKESLRIEDKQTQKGINLSLPGLVSRYEREKDKAIEDIVYYVNEALKIMSQSQHLSGREQHIFPVIRSTSFPTETEDGKKLVYKTHTAETRIYFAVDLDQSYRLIDKDWMENEHVDEKILMEMASFNLRGLSYDMKEDKVAGNTFYFLNTNDGYDASRILNQVFLEEMAEKMEGDCTVAVPHQDVLIIGDIVNKEGYDVLAQMTMHFFTNGNIPITSLPFIYENAKLEPIFILAKTKPEIKKD